MYLRIPDDGVLIVGELWPERVAAEPDGFLTDRSPHLSQAIFNVAMTQFKSMIEPNSVLNDFRSEAVTIVETGWTLHLTISIYQESSCQYLRKLVYRALP